MNKKVHLCGDFMYCDFGSKENNKKGAIGHRQVEKRMETLYRQFSKLHDSTKKAIVVCNKGSTYSKKAFVNPLKYDEYFQKIIKSKDEELVILLI